MDRRAFITIVGGSIFAAPLAGEAQQGLPRQVGFLNVGSRESFALLIAA